MSSLLYKRHSIIYGAALNEFTGRYAPTGQIVWHSRKGKHGAHSFALSELFSTADEAKAVAEEEAKTWASSPWYKSVFHMTRSVRGGNLGSQLVSDRVLGGDARLLGCAGLPTE